MDNDRETLRREVLRGFGADGQTLDALLDYCKSHFAMPGAEALPSFPMADEAHLEVWREYRDAAGDNVFAYLQARIPQLSIPITDGVSASDAYVAVTRRGKPFNAQDFGGRLQLQHPELLKLVIHNHPAGALPVLHTPARDDFVTLNRALILRSEPKAVNPSVNAQIVAGFINWDRMQRYREAWFADHDGTVNEISWMYERGRISKSEKWRFLDRFLILCSHPYSSLGADELGLKLDTDAWIDRSNVLRMEHEFMHYTTKRLYGVMRLNLLDEIIADWAGMTAALGAFDAALFLRMLGIDTAPLARVEGRVHTYTSELEACPQCLEVLYRLTSAAAQGLQVLTEKLYSEDARTEFSLALTRMSLELLASEERKQLFAEAKNEVQPLLG